MSAVLSTCGKYRYRLDREVAGEGLILAYFGINPSTANATVEDHTSRKWIGFTSRNGGRKYIAANIFAYRATDVKELASIEDPVGPDNRKHLENIMREADVLIACWGSRSKVPRKLHGHIDALTKLLASSGKPLKCFKYTKDGDPFHPLTLAYDTKLVSYLPRVSAL